MQSKFDYINNRLNMIENNIKSSTNNQVDESMKVCQILKTIINALTLLKIGCSWMIGAVHGWEGERQGSGGGQKGPSP